MTKIDFISLFIIHNNSISLRLQNKIWEFLVNIWYKLKMSLVTSVNKGCCSHPCKGAPWGDSGWERTGHWSQTGEVHIKGTITGRSQYWLHAGSVSLTIAIHCFCQGTLPLCMKVKVAFFSAHRETIWPSPTVNGCRKDKMNKYPLIVQDKWPFDIISLPPLISVL